MFSETSPDPACPTPNGTFRDKSNCSRYYTCIENTVAVKYECPAGLHFNDVRGNLNITRKLYKY